MEAVGTLVPSDNVSCRYPLESIATETIAKVEEPVVKGL